VLSPGGSVDGLERNIPRLKTTNINDLSRAALETMEGKPTLVTLCLGVFGAIIDKIFPDPAVVKII
jgi:hypothetical protein